MFALTAADQFENTVKQRVPRMADEFSRAQLRLQALYRANIRNLYDYHAAHMLEWPSLSLTWLPDRKNTDPDRDYSLQYIAVSTQAPPSAQNYINVLEVAIPVEEDDDDGGVVQGGNNSDDDVSGPGQASNPALSFRNIRGHLRVDQTVFCEGQVLRLRSMPQNTDIIAAKLTNGFVNVYDLATRLAAEERGDRVSAASMAPDVKLRGHRRAGFGLSWNCISQGVVASGSDDGLVMYWNIESQIRSIAESGSSDSLSTADRDVHGPVRSYSGHKGNVNDVSWHGSQEHLLGSASEDGSIRIWDTRVDQCALEYQNAHRVSANTLAFHPIASFQLATGGHDNMVKLWDIRKNDREVHRLIYHTGGVTCLEWGYFSESVLASSGQDGRVVMWDLEKVHAPENYDEDDAAPVELSFVHIGHTSRVTDIAWNPSLDEDWMIASCDCSNALHYYRPKSEVVHDYIAKDMFDVDNGDD